MLASWYVGAPMLAHIQKQNFPPPKRVSGINLPAHCSETPQIRSAYCVTSYNSNVSVQTIEQELLSGKYGIPEGWDIDCLLHQLGHILKISGGIVYPLRFECGICSVEVYWL